MLQLSLNDQQFYCLLRCALYYSSDGRYFINMTILRNFPFKSEWILASEWNTCHVILTSQHYYPDNKCATNYDCKLWMLKMWSARATNPLWPNDAMWWHRSGSNLPHVMDCGRTALSHYLNQCWLPFSEVLRHSPIEEFHSGCPSHYSLQWVWIWNL